MQDKFSNCRTCPAFAGHLKILRDKTLKCRTCPANAGRLATLIIYIYMNICNVSVRIAGAAPKSGLQIGRDYIENVRRF